MFEVMDDDKALELSAIFKALGDPTRLKIIQALASKEYYVNELATLLNMSQSAISHQLRLLRNLRLVKFEKEGKQVRYSLDDDHVYKLFEQGLEHINHT